MFILARGTSDDFVTLNGYCPLQILKKNPPCFDDVAIDHILPFTRKLVRLLKPRFSANETIFA